MVLRDKNKHFSWFAQKILQKSTGFKAQEVKSMLDNPDITYKIKVEVWIKEGRIISLEAEKIIEN